MKDVIVQLQELFDSLPNVIHDQNNEIAELKSKMDYLLKVSKTEEKRNLIAYILAPFTEVR